MDYFPRIKKKPVLNNLNDPLSLIEFNKGITKIFLHIAPGLNGVSPNAIKALNDENRLILFQICSDCLDNDVKIEDWKIGNLKILLKKENLQIQIIGEILIYLM